MSKKLDAPSLKGPDSCSLLTTGIGSMCSRAMQQPQIYEKTVHYWIRSESLNQVFMRTGRSYRLETSWRLKRMMTLPKSSWRLVSTCGRREIHFWIGKNFLSEIRRMGRQSTNILQHCTWLMKAVTTKISQHVRNVVRNMAMGRPYRKSITGTD